MVAIAAVLLSTATAVLPVASASAAASATQTVTGSVSHGAVVLDAGTDHTLGLSGGVVFAWGANSSGQLGDGTTTNRLRPVPIPIPDGPVRLIAAGDGFSLAATDTAVWAWGAGSSGQLGTGTTPTRATTPQRVLLSDTSAPVSIAAGGAFAVAALADGTVWTWGANDHGQLGDPALNGASSSVPVVAATGGQAITKVVAGTSHVLALQEGHPVAWGSNTSGELGNPRSPDSEVELPVPGVGGMTNEPTTDIAAGDGFSLALADGVVYSWGRDDLGQLGDGGTGGPASALPIVLPGTATDIDAGPTHAIAATSVGVYSWGEGDHGELGHCGTASSAVPVHVCDTASPGAGVSAGGAHSTVVDGGVGYAVGSNTSGQLGLGNYGQRSHIAVVTGGPTAPSATWDAVTGEAAVAWTNPATGAPAGGYGLTVRGSDGSSASFAASGTSATVTGLDPLIYYEVRVTSPALFGGALVTLPAFLPTTLVVTASQSSVTVHTSVSVGVEGFLLNGDTIGAVARHCGCTTSDPAATLTGPTIDFGTPGDQTVTADILGATGSTTVTVLPAASSGGGGSADPDPDPDDQDGDDPGSGGTGGSGSTATPAAATSPQHVDATGTTPSGLASTGVDAPALTATAALLLLLGAAAIAVRLRIRRPTANYYKP